MGAHLMGNRRVHLRIRGLVQGVSFRASARDAAGRLGLKGWVRNLSNGDVESIAEGEDKAIEQYVAWCHKGPPEADVDTVAVNDEPFKGEFTDFMVAR
ncbi:MAG: acylphosphatase [Myxococcaceae bacterium]